MQRRRDERIMIMEKKMTIKEIAELSGVSPTAVSFVPNAASKRLTMRKSFNVSLDCEKLVYEAFWYFIRHRHQKPVFLGSDWLPGKGFSHSGRSVFYRN